MPSKQATSARKSSDLPHKADVGVPGPFEQSPSTPVDAQGRAFPEIPLVTPPAQPSPLEGANALLMSEKTTALARVAELEAILTSILDASVPGMPGGIDHRIRVTLKRA